MANVNHADLTGSALHEPKGVASAAVNTVYASDGAGSGAWTDVNTLVTATNFTTGDAKLTFKTVADNGWVLMNDGTIGNALSGGSTRANADCEDLFTLFWNNISNTYAAVSGGRGANAAADWAANKTIALPKQLGRDLLIAGSGSGLSARSLGQTGGTETQSITTSNMPAHTHSASSSNAGSHNHAVTATGSTNSTGAHTHSAGNASIAGSVGGTGLISTTNTHTTSSDGNHDHTVSVSGSTSSDGTHSHTITVSTDGGGSAFSIMNPFSALNIMVKL